MNLSEALDAALPDIPSARVARGRPPRLDPDLVTREDLLDGEPIMAVLIRERGELFRFPIAQWNLATLFDGVRSYEEIADLYTEQTGNLTTADEIREFSEGLQDINFWFKTPQERNIALSQKLSAQRGRRAGRASKLNLAHITFSGWDPDRFLGWLDRAIGRYVYSPWSVLAAVLLFAFETSGFVAQWHVIAPDAVLYYNFAHKSFVDVVQFWILLLFVGFVHESAHGLTCKHYGGQVHSMGLLLIYLMPAFFCDITEAWVATGKPQRLAAIIAGIWAEMVLCGIGMIVWLNTGPGEWIHDLSYQLILMTGIAVIIVNLNPLIKLDGYFFLTEFLGSPDLKERSTSFLSGWFQSRILRLPVETPIVPRRRVLLFVVYAALSGIYSYLVLFFVVRFVYNVSFNFFAEFALIPAAIVFYLMFKSRLQSLRRVLSELWSKITADRSRLLIFAAAAPLILLLLFVPLFRDRESAYYVVEPVHQEMVHAAVPGRIDSVQVHEGEAVHAGQPLVRLSSPLAEALRDSATALADTSHYQAFDAEVQGKTIGGASARQGESQQSSRLAAEAQASREIVAPFDGIVLTTDPAALQGQQVASGQPLLNLAEAGQRVARIYVPASALKRIPSPAELEIALPGRFSLVRTTLNHPGGDPVSLPAGIIARQDYKGIKLPDFYAARVVLPASAGDLPFGVAGDAKIFGARRSIAARVFSVASDLVKAHVW